MRCEVHETGFLKDYKYVVIFARYRGKWLFARHRERHTWECAGGHIEPGETPLEAARRELWEETGALDFDISPVCDYWAGEDIPKTGGACGQVFFAQVRGLGPLPESEMAETGLFDALPEQLTYPEILQKLFLRICGFLVI